MQLVIKEIGNLIEKINSAHILIIPHIQNKNIFYLGKYIQFDPNRRWILMKLTTLSNFYLEI